MFGEAKALVDKQWAKWTSEVNEVDFIDPVDMALAFLDSAADELTADAPEGGEDAEGG